MRIAIAGAGPGGICAGIKLKAAGFDDFVILERSQRVGGTWANNRYPGLCCDTPSLLYSFTFEQKLDWTRTCARQPEIREYMQHCVDKYELGPHIRLGAEIVAARWDEDRWTLTLADGSTVAADVFIGAVGMFNELSRPDIAGVEDFAGVAVHTGDWPEEGLDVRGKRVAVIGCAASATQAVPRLAEDASSLVVYLRTPNWVVPKEDDAYTEAQLAEFRADPGLGLAKRKEQLDFAEALLTFDKPGMLKELEEKAHENRAVVEDPLTREKLRPTVPLGSQRMLFSNDFYPTFNLDHVELVDDPIESVTAAGVRTVDGQERPADVLVLATGYVTTKFLSVIDVVGRGGRRLEDVWRNGAHAYLGLVVPGFPNLFMLYGPNTNQGSILLMHEHGCDYIVRKLERMRANGLAWIDVRQEVVDEYNEALQRKLETVEVLQTIGTRYYRAPSGRIVTQWPYTMAEYRARTTRPDEDAFEERRPGDLEPVSASA